MPKAPISVICAGMIGITALLAFWYGIKFPQKKAPNIIVRPAGPVDPDLPFLLIRDSQNDKPLGSLTVFAMHVSTFWSSQFSADYPAYLQIGLRRQFGDKFISIFGIGAAGDIGNIDFIGKLIPGPDTEPDRIGNALATTILQGAAEMQPINHPDLAVRSKTLLVPLQEITQEQIARSYEIIQQNDHHPVDLLVIANAWKVLITEAFWKRFGPNLPMEVNVIRISADTSIVVLPHEIFVELGLAIKKASPFKHTLVITMAHDLSFYVPTKKAFAEGSYEVIASTIKPGGGERLVDTAVEMLRELSPATPRTSASGDRRSARQCPGYGKPGVPSLPGPRLPLLPAASQ